MRHLWGNPFTRTEVHMHRRSFTPNAKTWQCYARPDQNCDSSANMTCSALYCGLEKLQVAPILETPQKRLLVYVHSLRNSSVYPRRPRWGSPRFSINIQAVMFVHAARDIASKLQPT